MISFPELHIALESLSEWFLKNHRKLPFRENPSPYITWISEVMSQQTTIQAVIPYFEKFISRFPNINVLAKAKETDVLTLWSGLGYYSRGKNLHKTAQIIVQQHNSQFPSTYTELIKLPGIGAYTAGAILSIALKQPYPLVDTNVKRVFSRLRAKTLTEKKLWSYAHTIIQYAWRKNISTPSIINQAIMELGSLLCKPQEALCDFCPLTKICYVKTQKQNPLEFPKILPKIAKKQIQESVVLFYIQKLNTSLILVDSSERKWTKGFWDLPENTHPIIENSSRLKIIYTITQHKIERNITLVPLLRKEQLPPTYQTKDYHWLDITNLDLKNPHFPMSSALKKSIVQYKKELENKK